MEIYKKRRQKLCSELNNGIIIIKSGEPKVMSNDVEYDFRQKTNFYYLTGFKEPSSIMLLENYGNNNIIFHLVHDTDYVV